MTALVTRKILVEDSNLREEKGETIVDTGYQLQVGASY